MTFKTLLSIIFDVRLRFVNYIHGDFGAITGKSNFNSIFFNSKSKLHQHDALIHCHGDN